MGLPHIDDLCWLSGFEWKGVYVKVITEYQSKYLFNEIKALNYLFIEYIQIIDNNKLKNNCIKNSLLSNEIIFPLISYSRFNGLVLFCSNCINLYNYDHSIVNTNKNVMQRNSNTGNLLVNNDALFNENSKLFNLKSPRNQNNNNYYIRNSSAINNSRSNIGNKNCQIFGINSNANNINHLRKNSNNCYRNSKNNVEIFQSSNIENQKHGYSQKLINKDIFSPISRKNQKANKKNFNFADVNSNADKANYYTTDFNNGLNYNNTDKNKNIEAIQYSTNYEFKNNLNNEISNIENEASFYSMNISNQVNLDIDLTEYSFEDFKESVLFSKISSENLIKVIDDINENNNYNYINDYNTELNVEANINHIQNPKYKFMIISAFDLIPDLFERNKNYQFLFSPTAENKPFVIFDQYSIYKLNLKSDKTSPILDIKEALEKILGIEDLKKAEIINKNGFCGLNLKLFYNNYNDETMKDIDSQDKNIRLIDYFLNLSNKNVILDDNFLKTIKNIKSEKFDTIKNLFDFNKTELKGRSVVMYTTEFNSKLKYSLISKKLKNIFDSNNLNYQNNENKRNNEDKVFTKKKSYSLKNVINEKNLNNSRVNNHMEKEEDSLLGDDYLDNIDYLNHFENFTKYLDNVSNIENVKMLKNCFHRFGINTSQEIFTLPKLKIMNVLLLIMITMMMMMTMRINKMWLFCQLKNKLRK